MELTEKSDPFASQAPPQAPDNQFPKNNRKKYLFLGFVALFILLLLSIASFYLGKQSASVRDTNQGTTPSPVPSASSSILKPELDEEISGYATKLYLINGLTTSKLATLPHGLENTVSPILGDGYNVYYTEQNKIYKYPLTTKQKQIVYSSNKYIQNISFTKPNLLYITESSDQFPSKDATLIEWNLDNNTKRAIGTFEPYIYGYASYIKRLGSSDIIGTFGGDGCGGGALIYKNENGKITKLMETGGGCNIKPNYHGVHGEDFILAKVSERKLTNDTDISELGFAIFEELYRQDINTGETKTIYNLKEFGNGYIQIHRIKDTLLLTSKSKTVLIDLENDTATDYPALSLNPIYAWDDDKYIYVSGNGSSPNFEEGLLGVIDKKKKNIVSQGKPSVNISSKTLKHIGDLEGRPILYGNNYPKYD